MDVILDLFGVPIPEGRGKKGRPEHLVTPENVSKVNMLLAFGRDDAQISTALDISQPTLRKHYFHLLKRRGGARLQLEAWILSQLGSEIKAGNVAAMKELGRRLERHDLSLLSAHVQQRGAEDETPPLGKKGKQKKAAAEISGLYAPPLAPGAKPN